ncbi:SMPD4 family protein [Megaselia abdita]
MNFYTENLGNRVLELLNYPVTERCIQLGILFDKCSIRELQIIFPTLMNSIFGISTRGIGWGLRTTTKENSLVIQSGSVFDILCDFFSPLGPIYRLCYRLLHEQIKFEFDLSLLPCKMVEMIRNGHYPVFYADLLNIDPIERCASSLLLNAFDYYTLCFIVHGTFILHKMCPAALQVHNERLKTVYFFLTADYLSAFLPADPDTLVTPTICANVKAPQPMPVQQLQPTRSPKYLKISPVPQYVTNQQNSPTNRQLESPRTFAWRTESVLHFFTDTWLLYDGDEYRDLPSSEFIRVVRILVKQSHCFANSADFDNTSMAVLRKMTQPKLKSRILPFLKSIIARWPLDSSLSVVLELWLSYIQPWRYNMDNRSTVNELDQIAPHFEAFIMQNLNIYTQVFALIFPRFERLDFTSLRNAYMLYRLTKVFNQANLPLILRNCENKLFGSNSLRSPQRSNMNLRGSFDSSSEYHSFRGNDSKSLFNDEENYIPMFGHSVLCEIEQFIRKVLISKMCVLQDIDLKRKEIANRYKDYGLLKRWFAFLIEGTTDAEIKLLDEQKIPDILEKSSIALSSISGIELPNISHSEHDFKEYSYVRGDFTMFDESDYLDKTRINPCQMRRRMANIKSTLDPATLPILSYECTFLVRLLHKLSTRINEMVRF